MFIYVHFVYENVSYALPLGPVDVLWESAQHNCHKQHNYVRLYVQYIRVQYMYEEGKYKQCSGSGGPGKNFPDQDQPNKFQIQQDPDIEFRTM
jgi:hypothetical protein